MNLRLIAISLALATASLTGISATAHALSMQECSAKYKAAQQAGTLKGMKWNDFRKAECGSDATGAPTAAPASTTTTTAAPKTQKKEAVRPAPAPTAPAATASTGNAVFTSAVSPKYSTESAGKARMHTCLDQYNANKTNNGNGGLKWIEKGGGYYSECNKRLKG